MYKKSLFIFRRDLRLVDNTALIESMKHSESVCPIFIIDNRQVKNNKYRSESAVQFLIESLEDLEEQINKTNGKLHFFYGIAEDVIKKLIQKEGIEAVYYNRDYTPFSIARDKKIQMICRKNNVDVFSYHDALLTAPGSVLTNDGNPYTVYSPFYKKASQLVIEKTRKIRSFRWEQEIKSKSIINWQGFFKLEHQNNLVLKGGRAHAKKLLAKLSKIDNYHDDRNYPALSGVSHLSAHHKFGTISIRETYWKAVDLWGKDSQYIKELFWRDFYTHIAFHFPYVFKHAFNEKYKKLPWKNNKKLFQKWCEGKTGFPIVDAGMRELVQTGYMHNRVRMIVASFLTKDLHINWQWGEQFFAQHLVDYDPSVNNGSWQWAASTGCDAQPYFRIFNPWLQQKKFDPDAKYIKKWVPELRNTKVQDIHNFYQLENISNEYYKPIVDHKTQAAEIKEIFKNQ